MVATLTMRGLSHVARISGFSELRGPDWVGVDVAAEPTVSPAWVLGNELVETRPRPIGDAVRHAEMQAIRFGAANAGVANGQVLPRDIHLLAALPHSRVEPLAGHLVHQIGTGSTASVEPASAATGAPYNLDRRVPGDGRSRSKTARAASMAGDPHRLSTAGAGV